MVTLDFETASRADLLKIGAWKYAADLSTFMIMVQIKVAVDGKPQPTRVILEKAIHAIDPELLALCQDENVIFSAQNASFEQAMWKFHMEPIGYPPLPPERWHDTMAVSAMKALPLGLDAVVSALELPIRKDMDGHRLMLQMCKPDRHGGWSHHTQENIVRLSQYGATDCDAQYGLYLATKGLGASERETWILDQKINQRGIRIDKEFVHACMDVLEQVRVPMTERFIELTGVKPTQREKILNWVNDQGVPLGDMKKTTLDAILDQDDEFDIGDFDEPLPYHVHEAITLRRSLASSSVAKLQRMLDCAGSDGRVRYATQYHGARTGRDAGRLIQVQNYPRGEIGDRQGLTADILADAILTRDVERVRELWGNDIFSAIISSLRSCIVPEKGKVLVAGDFAQVEARNLLSMAGQHDRVEQMHAGLDVYSETASMIYKRPINRKVDMKEGQIGKNTVLGCLAADTLVLTSNGWKAIVDVQLEDMLWDGEDWVTHEGLKFKGIMETLDLSGLRMTPDHLVFIGDRWSRADAVTPSMMYIALDFAKAHGPSLGMLTPNAGSSKVLYASAIAAKAHDLWTHSIFAIKNLWDAAPVRVRKPIPAIETFAGIQKYAQMNFIEIDWLNESIISRGDAIIQKTKDTKITEGEVLNLISQAEKHVLHIWLLLKDGITRHCKSIELTTMGIIRKEICALPQVLKITKIDGKFGNLKPKSSIYEPVYDLVNAGSRHRFTVMTSDGPLIVHNSGYGLGPVGFRARFAPKEPMDLALLAIGTYRKDFAPKVVPFWYGLWQASVDAVWCEHAKAYSYEGIEFRREGDFLTMRLPSLRKLYYHRPRKEKTTDPYGNERPSWSFMSYQGKKFRRHLAWHGMITADCIQGSARDLMVSAMKKAEAAGLNTIFKVHDELVFEEADRPDLVATVKQIMEDIDPWARERRFRVKAEVESMLRYRK